MTACVFDSSAVLAIFYGEKGGRSVEPLLKTALISTVNFSEVEAKLISKQIVYDQVQSESLLGQIVPFTLAQARLAANLIKVTKPLGLSLGDRACLALALERGLPVYTANQVWAKLHLPLEIRLLR